MGPWPISALPFHVPTSAFNRSNSGELAFTFTGSLACNHVAPASTNVAQTEVIFVFIFVVLFVFPTFTTTTNDWPPSGHRFCIFLLTPSRRNAMDMAFDRRSSAFIPIHAVINGFPHGE